MAQAVQLHLNQALMRIPRRAESADRSTLAATYVAAGSFSALINSADHQILFGRRGTGKTHGLLHLQDLVERTGDVALYLDLRTIGSTGGLYANEALAPAQRGTQLLVDTLEAVHDQLLTLAVDGQVPDPDGFLHGLDALVAASTEVEVVGETEQEQTRGAADERRSGLEASLGRAAGVRGSLRHNASTTASSRRKRTGVEQHRVLFGPLSRALQAVADGIRPARLWLLLDEWSSVPLDLQPFLADLVRRGVLPIRGITVKIAAIEHRARFFVPVHGDYLGIEVGSDAASTVSLDDALVFDESRERAQAFFRELFSRHVRPVLEAMVRPAPDAAEAFRDGAFAELVRAAEGVPRDAINIAALAAQHAHADKIAVAHVRRAARDWYLRDKRVALSRHEDADRLLARLVDEVVGRRRSRTFLLPTADRPPAIDALCDARLLHVLRRGVVDPRRPGRSYDGFAIDYGCYVALLTDDTKNVPNDVFAFDKAVVDLTRLGG
ncbi:hypothetical protein MUY14_23685 [Amycolatopsis sp. FBCC-B4732]|uniref:hypothetical protein n=1 Tax=Amycolatopsis sp. FBCC-B4732 TaxID=3079339 RepID=UPI001FF1AD2E|nr:hypothetical protein [Amycolatopsis sp. FBCC-B4732]UOX84818.1 hypothetical protein MUY14_23685 [Amycolatopsis sp. FBCC-B4732]